MTGDQIVEETIKDLTEEDETKVKAPDKSIEVGADEVNIGGVKLPRNIK